MTFKPFAVQTEYRPYSGDHETAMKKLFAATWLRHPESALQAANEIEPEFAMRAVWIVQNWQNDEVVLAEKQRLLDLQGPIARVATQEELALEVYKLAHDGAVCKTVNDKLSAYKFFAELMKYTEKAGGPNINIQNNLNASKIMAVPMCADDNDWEVAAKKLQVTLQARHDKFAK